MIRLFPVGFLVAFAVFGYPLVVSTDYPRILAGVVVQAVSGSL